MQLYLHLCGLGEIFDVPRLFDASRVPGGDLIAAGGDRKCFPLLNDTNSLIVP
jgi:hypothetical protein